jgi:hypothetical protein
MAADDEELVIATRRLQKAERIERYLSRLILDYPHQDQVLNEWECAKRVLAEAAECYVIAFDRVHRAKATAICERKGAGQVHAPI